MMNGEHSDFEATNEPSVCNAKSAAFEGKSVPSDSKPKKIEHSRGADSESLKATMEPSYCKTMLEPFMGKSEPYDSKSEAAASEYSDFKTMSESSNFEEKREPSRVNNEHLHSKAKLTVPSRANIEPTRANIEPSDFKAKCEPFGAKSLEPSDSADTEATSESSDFEAKRESSRAKSEHFSFEGKREHLRAKGEHFDSHAKPEPARAKSTEPSDFDTKIEPARVKRVKSERFESIAKGEPFKEKNDNNNGSKSKEVEVICISSDEEKEVRKRGNDTRAPRVPSPSLDCSVCKNEMIAASKVHEHPFLPGVGVCSDCFDNVFNGHFTKLDGHEKQCRWCGDGGKIALCERCERGFCKDCIIRNFGHKKGWLPILEDNNWICFCCNPLPLHVRMNEFRTFRKAIAGSRLEFFNLKQNSSATSPTNKNNVNSTELNKSIKRPKDKCPVTNSQYKKKANAKGKKSNKRPMQKEKKSSKRPVQNKSNKGTREEELKDMEEAYKRMGKGVKLAHEEEYARAIKKYKKAIQFLDIDTQYFEDMKKQAEKAKIGCYNGILTCMKELVEDM